MGTLWTAVDDFDNFTWSLFSKCAPKWIFEVLQIMECRFKFYIFLLKVNIKKGNSQAEISKRKQKMHLFCSF